jgi:uncharacterized Zn finger protein
VRPWDFPRSGPKAPPPEHGIKVKKAGTTWWGKLWLEALERLSHGYAGRLARGRTYARAGRTHDLTIEAGRVTAKVTGSRPKPYDVTLELAPLSNAAWDRSIAAMAERAQFSAELLGGRMPENIEEAFTSAKASLFPSAESELVTDCSCPDFANPCKHVAATHYVLGEAFDADPFLLFELRGRTKERVLDALRARRAGGGALERRRTRDVETRPPEEPEIPRVTLDHVEPEAYDTSSEPLPALNLSFEEPAVHGAVLEQLGAPGTWAGKATPAELFSPLLRAAAERARGIALGSLEADAAAVPVTAPKVANDRAPRAALRKKTGKSGKKAKPRAPIKKRK